MTTNTLSPVQTSLPIQPEYQLTSGPTFDALMHRYAGQERKYLNDQNYVPTVAEFHDLQMLSDDIRVRPQIQPNGWEERPEAQITFVGPHGEVDPKLAVRVKRLADPATWLRNEGDERLFVEAASALEGRIGTPHRTEKEELGLFDAAESAAVGSIFDTGSLTPEKFDRLAELSRVSRRQLEHQGVDTRELERRRPTVKVSASAPVPGQGRGYDLESESLRVGEDRVVRGRARAKTQEKQANYEGEPNEDTLLRLLQDQENKVISEGSVAAVLYPEKMARGSSTYNDKEVSLREIPKDVVRGVLKGAMRRIRREGPVELGNLTQGERARVAKLTHQLEAVRRLEKQDVEHYRAGLDRVPAWYEISAAVFPESKGRGLTDAELNVVETVRARLEDHHQRQAKPDRFMRLRIAMTNARKGWSELVADAKLEVTDAKEFITRNARTARVAGAAALAMTVAIAVTPDMNAPVQANPKALVNSAAILTVSRRGTGYETGDGQEAEQKPDELMPTAGRKPTGSYPRHQAIEVEYR